MGSGIIQPLHSNDYSNKDHLTIQKFGGFWLIIYLWLRQIPNVFFLLTIKKQDRIQIKIKSVTLQHVWNNN